MPKRIPAQTITVVRKGKLVTPPIGEPYDFTASEIEDVERLNPSAFDSRTVIEGAAVVVKKVVAADDSGSDGADGANGDGGNGGNAGTDSAADL